MMSFCKIILSGFKVVAVFLCAALQTVRFPHDEQKANEAFIGGATEDPVIPREFPLIGETPRVQILDESGKPLDVKLDIAHISCKTSPSGDLIGKPYFSLFMPDIRTREGEALSVVISAGAQVFDTFIRYDRKLGACVSCGREDGIKIFYKNKEPVPERFFYLDECLQLTLTGELPPKAVDRGYPKFETFRKAVVPIFIGEKSNVIRIMTSTIGTSETSPPSSSTGFAPSFTSFDFKLFDFLSEKSTQVLVKSMKEDRSSAIVDSEGVARVPKDKHEAKKIEEAKSREQKKKQLEACDTKHVDNSREAILGLICSWRDLYIPPGMEIGGSDIQNIREKIIGQLSELI